MELHNIVLHHIKREKNKPPKLMCSDHLLDSSDPVVGEFVIKLIKSFSNKNPTYGKFQDDSIAYPFQNYVSDFLHENDFLKFSIDSMKLLEKEIQVPQAKGGYVVFTNYSQKGQEFLITIMLDKAEQFTTDDESLDIRKLKTLDIDRLARANRLNISKWNNNDDLYLAFIKGTRDVSGYFQKFIGNTDLTSSKINAQNLKSAISSFMQIEQYSYDQKEIVNSNIGEYLNLQYSSDRDVELSSIAAHLIPDNPEAFLNYVSRSDIFDVSDNFRLAKKADFAMFHKSKVIGDGFKLEFEKNLIKIGKILREDNDIVIKDIPIDILDREFDI